MPKYIVRKGTAEDLDKIALHRVSMFRDMGSITESEMDELKAASLRELDTMMAHGEYLAWLVECDAAVVAGGGMIIRRLLPRPKHLSGGRDAQILNVFTDPGHRKKGVARLLMTEMMKWCRENGIDRISLHASDAGRHLYESLGFSPTNEMRYES